MINLEMDSFRTSITQRVLSEIDMACVQKYDDGHRNHLGASIIGKECSRYLWYVFRHVHHQVFRGQMYRLFNRGHLEEIRIIEWLRWCGFKIWEVDENGKQFKISDVCGHFGGSMDGVCRFPENYGIDEPILLEFKTHKKSGFDKLVKNGVELEKPQHFDQMCVYGYKNDLKYALYICVCKDNDQIHMELLKLDYHRAIRLLKKAEYVINSEVPPERQSNSSASFMCKFCEMRGVCWNNEPIERSCRSCKIYEPIEGGKWKCKFEIPDINPKKGCVGYWKPIC